VKRWLLDTSALLALRDDEAGADRVAALLGQAQAGRAACFGCFMSLMEVYYRVWKDEGAKPPAGWPMNSAARFPSSGCMSPR
jgi:predicted nucleic acid-binding protein